MKLTKDIYLSAFGLAILALAFQVVHSGKKTAPPVTVETGNVAYDQKLNGRATLYAGIYRVVAYTVVQCASGQGNCIARETIRARFRSTQTITLNPDGSVVGAGACNGITARFNVSQQNRGGDLRQVRGFFSNFKTTERICGVYDEESILLNGLYGAELLFTNQDDKNQVIISAALPASGHGTVSLELQKIMSFDEHNLASAK